MLCVLVVEDVPQHRRRIARELSERHSGYEVHAVASRDEALAIMATRRPDLVLLDLIIPSGPRRRDANIEHGEAVLSAAQQAEWRPFIVVLSAHGEYVRDFLKERGVDDYFVKDWPQTWEQEKLMGAVEGTIGHFAARCERSKAVLEQLRDIAGKTAVVTLCGPLGSGRRHAARLLHRSSRRRRDDVEARDVAELFADGTISGLVGRANGAEPGLLGREGCGCVILTGLERIGELGEAVQEQLAALVERIDSAEGFAYSPLGSSAEREADVLLAFVSAEPIERLREGGRISDRLAAALLKHPVVEMPPAWERLEDVGEIADMMRVRMRRERRGEGPGGICETAVRMLERWMELARPASGWRALERVVEEAFNRCEGEEIGPWDLELEGVAARYEAVICRGGELERRRVSEVEAIALLDEPWPLVLRSEQDEAGGRVVEVVVEGEKRAVRDARLGRVLHLLAFNAGEVVEIAQHKRRLGIRMRTPAKKLIMAVRRILGDTRVEERRSRYIASCYSEAYMWLCEHDFLLLLDRAEGGAATAGG